MTTMQDPMGFTGQQLRNAVSEIGAVSPVTTVPGVEVESPRGEPLLRVTWTDPVTGTHGYLVVHSLVSGMATGGTRMRPGCTLTEVEDLAFGMAAKTATFDLPIGGAKGGIDYDPKAPDAIDVLARFCDAMRPFIHNHWVTAEDLGVPQHLIDTVFARLGLHQSYYAAINRSPNPDATLHRIRAGLNATVPGGLLGDVIGGYGVAQACLGAAHAWHWTPTNTTAAIQGIGTMGGAAAWYLHQAGIRVVAIADAAGTLYNPTGLDIPTLLNLRDTYGEIDRTQLPPHTQQLPTVAIIATDADILVPAAISYAITPDNSYDIKARVIIEAANAATTPEAETMLTTRGIPVIPDFVANAGAAAWAWWLLLGQVDDNPDNSFTKLRTHMHTKIAMLLHHWNTNHTPPRHTGWALAHTDRSATPPLIIP